MKVSIRASYVARDVVKTVTTDLRRAREAGYEALEMCLLSDGTMTSTLETIGKKGVDALLVESSRMEVPITSLSADWAWQYGTGDRPLSDWDEGIRRLGRDAELARALGARCLLVHFGTSHGTWEAARAILARAGDAAAEQGVRLGFETSLFGRCGLGGFDELLRMLDELDHPAVGAYEHCHYPRSERPAHQRVLRIGRRLYGYHSSVLTPQSTDYAKLCAAFKEVGYEGDWVFEIDWSLAREQRRLYREVVEPYM